MSGEAMRTEDRITEAIERCGNGTADPHDRSLAAAAMVRAAYACAGLEPVSFARWLKAIAADIERDAPRSR